MSKYGNKFDSNLSSGNVGMIKSEIVSLTDSDKYMPQFQFKEAAKYAHEQLRRKGKMLFTTDNGEWKMPSTKTDWNEDVWRSLKIEMMTNFSVEKINAMEELMFFLRKSGHPKFQVQENNYTRMRDHNVRSGQGASRGTSRAIPSTTSRDQRPKTSIPGVGDIRMQTAICVGGGLIAGGVVGALMGAKVLGAVLGGAAGFGAAFHLYKKGN